MKYLIILFIAAVFPGICHVNAQDKKAFDDLLQVKHSFVPDIPYDQYDRTTFDLYMPEPVKEKMPLVIFFHGGSFIHGDKSQIKGQVSLADSLLRNGIAFASANYRYRENNDSLGVQKCLNDAVRCLQFIRYHAGEYHIDPANVACYGESAGAGISLFLAFHDDMAIPDATDPQKRESTRIACAGAIATQSTYNLFRWKKIIPFYWLIFNLKRKDLNLQIANFYGFKTFRDFRPLKKEITGKTDMLKMLSPDDPPVWLCNMVSDKIKKGLPHNENQLFHHPAHAIAVGKKAKKEGVTHYVITNEKEKYKTILLCPFLKKYLNNEIDQ